MLFGLCYVSVMNFLSICFLFIRFVPVCASYWLLDWQDGEAYAYLLNVLAPEHCSPTTLDTKDPTERAKLILEHAERMNCKKYLTPKDIVDGSTNLNLAFVAHIFHHRYSTSLFNFISNCTLLISLPLWISYYLWSVFCAVQCWILQLDS